jgi:hypothetical protein
MARICANRGNITNDIEQVKYTVVRISGKHFTIDCEVK